MDWGKLVEMAEKCHTSIPIPSDRTVFESRFRVSTMLGFYMVGRAVGEFPQITDLETVLIESGVSEEYFFETTGITRDEFIRLKADKNSSWAAVWFLLAVFGGGEDLSYAVYDFAVRRQFWNRPAEMSKKLEFLGGKRGKS